MRMRDLTEQEQKEEIQRIEERSLFYLKAFVIFCSTVIFFIIRESGNIIAEKIKESLTANLFTLSHVPGIITTMALLMLALVILYTIWILCGINIKGILSYEDQNGYKNLLSNKYEY